MLKTSICCQTLSSSKLKVNLVVKKILTFRLAWKDEFLRWKPEMHGGITKIALSSDMVWTPDIYLWNSISEEFYSLEDMDLTLTSDG